MVYAKKHWVVSDKQCRLFVGEMAYEQSLYADQTLLQFGDGVCRKALGRCIADDAYCLYERWSLPQKVVVVSIRHWRDGVCQEAWVRCQETLQFIRRRDGVCKKAFGRFEQTMQVGEMASAQSCSFDQTVRFVV
jgi:hypothetical protein